MMKIVKIAVLLCSLFVVVHGVQSQTFGQNQPKYKSFDFKVLQTSNFDIHYYTKNREVLEDFATMMEDWHDLFQTVLHAPFAEPNPFILYDNHADFQMTNAVSGTIGVGTGGVTEMFFNRVVMPLTFTRQQTKQVLGHELVHAFQFNIAATTQGSRRENLFNLPLWFIEGMAEYMSMGRFDPFTAMWMRDAVINDKVPTLREMANPRYFPYRYGQTAMSYLTGRYGDDVIEPLLKTSVVAGLEVGMKQVLGQNEKELSVDWQNTLKSHFNQFKADHNDKPNGRKILSEENSGRNNVSPTVSPNGKYVAFLSEKDLFSYDIFVADSRNGKIIKKMVSLIKDKDLDNLSYLESVGTWSPDSKQFALVGFQEGVNVLIIKEALTGKTIETSRLDDLPSFANPAWHPDGKNIVVVGLVNGQTDLYNYNIKSGRVRQLTDTKYSEIQPSFAKEGDVLTFSYDKNSVEQGPFNGRYTFDLATMDLSTSEITVYDVFPSANNLNPNFDENHNLYFISDRDGFRNLYHLDVTTGEVKQMTNLFTGISGISRFSPAISVSQNEDRVIYNHYNQGRYSLYSASSKQFLNKAVDKNDVDFAGGMLPPPNPTKKDIISKALNNFDDTFSADRPTRNQDSKNKLMLANAQAALGATAGNNLFGNNLQTVGGVSLFFSDILGNNQLFTNLSLNGDISDFAGQGVWVNKKHRINYGVSAGHIPQSYGFLTSFDRETIEIQGGGQIQADVYRSEVLRIFNESLGGFAQYPISRNLRIEGAIGGNARSFRRDSITQFYESFTGQFLGEDRTKLPSTDQVNFGFYSLDKGISANTSLSIVGDNSTFGLTSPLNGYRFRFEVGRSFGTDDFTAVNLDYRKYTYLRPFSIAFRGSSLFKFNDSDVNTSPVYLGQMGTLHGFDFFFNDPFNSSSSIDQEILNNLIGQKAIFSNLEFRLPLTGPKQFAVLNTTAFYSDLNFFFDAGMTFNSFDNIGDAPIISTTGVGLRINLYGIMILEPYYYFGITKVSGNGFGLNIVPGW